MMRPSFIVFLLILAAAIGVGAVSYNPAKAPEKANQETTAPVNVIDKEARDWENPKTSMRMPMAANEQNPQWRMTSVIKRPMLMGNGEDFSLTTYAVLENVNAALLPELRLEAAKVRVNVKLASSTQTAKAVRKIDGVLSAYANAAPRGE